MNKEDLLFYSDYEEFYTMAAQSKAFQAFCKEAYGEDFSQDGFSNMEQINKIIPYIPTNAHILDIGCGNGKMLGYLQQITGAYIHGFDYSEQAISTAQKLYPVNSEFREGIIGEIEYEAEQFDVIISMDTMYFAKDMTAFVAQVKRWLKPGGVFFVGYQEGDVMPKTENAHSTMFAKAVQQNGMQYEVRNFTKQVYELLQKKRMTALKYRPEFGTEEYKKWYMMLIEQTKCVMMPLAEFQQNMARYLYIVRK